MSIDGYMVSPLLDTFYHSVGKADPLRRTLPIGNLPVNRPKNMDEKYRITDGRQLQIIY